VRLTLLLAGLLAGGAVQGQSERALVLHGGRVWTGESFAEGWEVVVGADGRVLAAGRDPSRPRGARLRDLQGAYLLPGLVHAAFAGGAEGDPASVQPGVLAADDFDPDEDLGPVLASGISVAYQGPGRARFIPGVGSIVQPFPRDLGGSIRVARAALHTNLHGPALAPPGLFVAAVPPGPDNPVRPPQRQRPTGLADARELLFELFGAARAARDAGSDGRPSAEDAPDLRPFVEALGGSLPWRVLAHREAEIRLALDVAEAFGLRLIVEGATEAWRLSQELAAGRAAVVLEVGDPVQGRLPGPPPFADPRGEAALDALSRLHAAGVAVALVPRAAARPEDFLWFAAQARSAGASDAAVLAGVTVDAARVLGVEAGRIAPGLVADLAVFDRHPFAPGSAAVARVLGARWVASPKAARDPSPVLAVRAARIHVDPDTILENATLVVRDGKVVAVGSGAAPPPGAVVHEFPGATIVPGFIDAGGQVGYRSLREQRDGELVLGPSLGALGLDQRPSELFDPGFPDVLAAARAGVTTVALVPGGGREFAGWISLVKTGGPPGRAVIEEAAGLLLDLTGTRPGPEELDRIRKAFESGKKYAESWTKYEKDLAAWKAKQKAQPPVPAPRPKLEAQPARDGASGTWEGTAWLESAPRELHDFRLEIRREGGALVGELRTAALGPEPVSLRGQDHGPTWSLEFEIEGGGVRATLEVERDRVEGTFTGEATGSGRLRARRIARATPPPPPAPPEAKAEAKAEGGGSPQPEARAGSLPADERPKEPRRVKAEEPYRLLLQGERPVFVLVQSSRFAGDILHLLRDEFEVRTVLVAPDLVPARLDLLDELGVALASTGPGIRREEGRFENPLRLVVERGLPVALRTGQNGDARTLRSAASYAVHRGLQPRDGLAALTRWPATIFGQEGRLGTLARGRDADFVVLDGDPMAPGTRVVRVAVNGEFVPEALP
jgi:imidazolonepropionase-like amidohydrolase